VFVRAFGKRGKGGEAAFFSAAISTHRKAQQKGGRREKAAKKTIGGEGKKGNTPKRSMAIFAPKKWGKSYIDINLEKKKKKGGRGIRF